MCSWRARRVLYRHHLKYLGEKKVDNMLSSGCVCGGHGREENLYPHIPAPEVSLRGIRGDCVLLVTRLLTCPQRKPPADLQISSPSFRVWKQRAPKDKGFTLIPSPSLPDCPSCICSECWHVSKAEQLSHSAPYSIPPPPSPPPPPLLLHHIICWIYCAPLTNCQRAIPPPANVYWSKHKYGCGKGMESYPYSYPGVTSHTPEPRRQKAIP